MYVFRRLSLVLLCAVVQFGCSDSDSNDFSDDFYQEVIFESPDDVDTQVDNMASRFDVNCSFSSCNPSVGVLFRKVDGRLSRCTTFIVGEDGGKHIMATNKHCIEEVTNCSEQVYFKFPSQLGYSLNEAACESIELISKYELEEKDEDGDVVVTNNPDYAFIKLDKKLDRPVISMKQNGLDNLSAINAVYYDARYKGSRSFIQKKVKCSTGAKNSMYQSSYMGPFSPVVSLYECDVKGGNSGGPVFNEQGEAVAIIQTSTGKADVKIPGIDTSRFDTSKFGGATNISCIDYSPLGLRAPKDSSLCDLNAKIDSKDLISTKTLLLDVTKKSLADIVDLMESDEDQVFEWSLKELNKKKVPHFDPYVFAFEIAPDCVIQASDERSGLSKFKTNSFGLFESWEERVGTSKSTNVYFVGLTMNSLGVVESEVKTAKKISMYVFNPEQINSLKDGEKIDIVERVDLEDYSHSLKTCDISTKEKMQKKLDDYKEALELNGDEFFDRITELEEQN